MQSPEAGFITDICYDVALGGHCKFLYIPLGLGCQDTPHAGFEVELAELLEFSISIVSKEDRCDVGAETCCAARNLSGRALVHRRHSAGGDIDDVQVALVDGDVLAQQ